MPSARTQPRHAGFWTLPIDATCASWLGCKGNATIRFCMRKEQFARSESRLEGELERARAIPLFSDTLLPTRSADHTSGLHARLHLVVHVLIDGMRPRTGTD